MRKIPRFQRNNNTWWHFQIFKMLGYAAYFTRTPKDDNLIWRAYLSYGRGTKFWRIWHA